MLIREIGQFTIVATLICSFKKRLRKEALFFRVTPNGNQSRLQYRFQTHQGHLQAL